MHPIRKSILEILKREGHVTVNDLAEHLDMAPVSVRHHLDLLIGDGLVSTPEVRRNAGAGRPQQLYALTPEASAYFPNNFRQLAEATLIALKTALPPAQVLAVMDEMATRTASEAPAPLPGVSLQEWITNIVKFLNEKGYMASYEVEQDTIVLHTCNCPYRDLITPHGELCHMDAILMGKLTHAELQRIAHIAQGDGRCSYRLPINGLHEAQTIPLLLSVPAASHASC